MIFISYRISDSLDLVGRLDADLCREFGGDNVFRDKSRLKGGQDWTQELENNAKGCRVMLVVIGETWQTAAFAEGERKGFPRLSDPEDWVRKEITFALDAGNLVIPVFLKEATMPSAGWLKNCGLERLHPKQGVALRSTEYARDSQDLIALLRQHCSEIGAPSAEQSGDKARRRLPVPPELYAVPNYILTNTFIGRATELDKLDAWAKSQDPLMVVEGIGGLGKSALTWEWVKNRAKYAIPDLAGTVWWSFYEKGTSMSEFVRHALAYVTQQDPESLKELSHYERCQDLLTELRRRPYLLVLDGLERVLTAYARWDKAQQRDDEIESNLRECVDPKDKDLLQQLLHGSPSKVMLSTRLFPSALEDKASQRPIPGVAHHHLNGLSRPDTLAFLKHVGIKGNEQAMLDFADQFGRHSLLLKVICGEIAQYPRRPFDFEAWRSDSHYGGKLKLSALDLKQRYNHILRFALEGLDEPKRKLLCRIAVLSENAEYDTLAAINPYFPTKPESVEKPEDPTGSWRWGSLTEEQRQERLAAFEQSQVAYGEYQVALQSYQAAAQKAMLPFNAALRELQDRGLLQRDHDNGQFDMHPVVRGHAAELLEEGDRKVTFLAARDYFSSLPPDNLATATEFSHVAHSVEIYRCLLGAGLLDAAAEFYRGALADTLLFHLGANTQIIELLTPLFLGGQGGLPNLSSVSDQSYILSNLAISQGYLGHNEEELRLFRLTLPLDLNAESWSDLAVGLRNISVTCAELGLRAEAATTLQLARELAEAADDEDGLSMALFFQAAGAINAGQFADGERLLEEFRARPQPPVARYRPGDAEYWSCVSQFYQGKLTESEWQGGYDLAVRHRNVITQYRFLALRSQWLLGQDQASPALEAIDEALKIVHRLGTPKPEYHDLRAWALAQLRRAADAQAELTQGPQRLSAAEAWLILGDQQQALACALNTYRRAWGEGPPYILWYSLERSRALLKQFGEPEPDLPPFDPSQVNPIPYAAEIREAIAKLNARKKGA